MAAGRDLHLLIKPDGSKFWVFRNRFEGNENSLSMGHCPNVSLAEAQERVREAHNSIVQAINPSEKRNDLKAEKIANKTNTFELWVKKWWQHMAKKAKSPATLLLILSQAILFKAKKKKTTRVSKLNRKV